jgi:hypothetical protein
MRPTIARQICRALRVGSDCPGADLKNRPAKKIYRFRIDVFCARLLEDVSTEARRSAEARCRAATQEMAERFERAVAGIIARVASAAAALQATARQMADTAQGTARDSNRVAAGQAEANIATFAAATGQLDGSTRRSAARSAPHPTWPSWPSPRPIRPRPW